VQKFLAIVIGALAVVAVGVLVVAVEGQYHIWMGAARSERYTLLPGIAVSAGVLIAALSFLREKAKSDIERRRHVSEVLLAQASAGLKTVVDLLSDQNNNRMTWIRAARTLLQAQSLGRRIDAEEYAVAYKLEEERTRNELYKVLTITDPKTGARQSLPPQFFYGIDDWRSVSKLDDAAIKADHKSEAYKIEIDTVPPASGLRPLADRAVIAIYAFVEYPKDYDDPLTDVAMWDENWDQSLGIDQGARRYVAHKKMKSVVAGKIIDKAHGTSK
jgi:hypothetical protein